MQKRPFNKNQVQVLRKMLAENPRDFALLNTGIDTSLRSKDLRSCQLILGHRSVSNTALYLGVQQEDAFEQVRKHRI